MSLFPNQPFNLFSHHVFAKYDGKYYDPSYSIKNSTKYADDDDKLLEDHSSVALTEVIYAKLNTAGEAIHDSLHSGLYINPTQNYQLKFTPTNADKYEYKNINTSMQNHLDKDISAV